MGVLSKFKDLMGFEEYEEEEEMEEEEEYKKSGYYDRKPVEPRASTMSSSRYDSSNVVPMQNRTRQGYNQCLQTGGNRACRF